MLQWPIYSNNWMLLLKGIYLPLQTKKSLKYLGKNIAIFRGWCKTASMMSRRCQKHDVTIWSVVVTLRFEQLKWHLNGIIRWMKAWEKNNQSMHCKDLMESRPYVHDLQALSWTANYGHSDEIPLSLLQCSDSFYKSRMSIAVFTIIV